MRRIHKFYCDFSCYLILREDLSLMKCLNKLLSGKGGGEAREIGKDTDPCNSSGRGGKVGDFSLH